MIDTAQKRMSVFQLPGLMTNPFPSGGIEAPDRQQISDVYAGIASAGPLPRRCTSWVAVREKTSPWINSKKNTSIWVPEKEKTKIWEPEKEVVPCD